MDVGGGGGGGGTRPNPGNEAINVLQYCTYTLLIVHADRSVYLHPDTMVSVTMVMSTWVK